MNVNKPLYWEYGGEYDITPGNPRYISPRLAMREGKWKLLMNNDKSKVELHNLAKDQAETNNLAEKQPERVKEMSEKLLNWKSEMP